MKTLTTFLFNIIFLTSAFSQNIDKLDQENGFDKFKFGDNLSKWENQLEYKGVMSASFNIENNYVYKGSCCQEIFGYPVMDIIITFKNDLLVMIQIDLEQFQGEFYVKSDELAVWRVDDFEKINSELTKLYGESLELDGIPQQKVVNYWQGKKVAMVSTYEFLGEYEGDQQILQIIDLNYIKNISKE